MRKWDEIWKNRAVKTHESWMGGYSGTLELKGTRSPFIFLATIDKGNEHVSVHIKGSTKKTPSWEDMCRIKNIFWSEEEEVHQVHPCESEYVHRFGKLENVLHLWRPESGWNW